MSETRVELRAFPYPFRAMLAINSDIDRCSPMRFREVHRFLNTREETPMGPGLGFDVADSMWFYRPRLGRLDPISTELSYFHGSDWSVVSPYAEEVLHYVRCGWIDTIHGYGNFTGLTDPDRRFTRRHAEEALAVLERERVRVPVWSNHGGPGNIQNIGRAAEMHGDDPDHPAYHADLLRGAGILFQWGMGAATVPGAVTKLVPYQLKDGHECWQFTRFSSERFEDAERDGLPPWQVEQERTRRAAPMLWLPRWLHVQLSEPVLDEIVDGEQFAIVAQHLGTARPMIVMGGPAVDALRRLADRQTRGDVLVVRTARMLAYNRAREHLRYEVGADLDRTTIDITGVEDPVLGAFTPTAEDLRGITFRVEDPSRTRLLIDGAPVNPEALQRNPTDGRSASIGFAWFEPDYQDHGEPFLDGLRVLPAADERHRLDLAGRAALRAVAGAEPPAGVAGAAFATAVAAAKRAYGQPLSDLVTKVRALGFMEFEAVQLGSGAGEWCVALAKAGAATVVGLDPRPAFVAAAALAAGAAGVADAVEFRLAGDRPESLENRSCEFILWRSSPGFVDAESVIDLGARPLRQNSALLASYTSFAGYIRSLERLLDIPDRDWSPPVRKLLAGRVYRHGLAVGPDAGGMPDFDELLAIADSRGLALVDQPRITDGVPSYLGRPITQEALFRRERDPDRLRDELAGSAADDELVGRLGRLLERGMPRLVADVLAPRVDELRELPELRRLLLLALVKAGRAGEAVVEDLIRAEQDPLALGLSLHALGDLDGALAHYMEVEPTPALLVGVARLADGNVDGAEAVFTERAADQRLDCDIGTLQVAVRRGDRNAGRQCYERLVHELSDGGGRGEPLPDRSTAGGR